MTPDQFQEAKNNYVQARKAQRTAINAFLKADMAKSLHALLKSRGVDATFSLTRGVGQGKYENWMWGQIHAPEINVSVFVPLQVFDHDPTTGNVHTLFDQLGVLIHDGKDIPHQILRYSPSSKDTLTQEVLPSTPDELRSMVIRDVLLVPFNTEITLPMTDEKFEKLKAIVLAKVEKFINSRKSALVID